MKKKNNLCRKIGNKKLVLNKVRISELLGENMNTLKGGGGERPDVSIICVVTYNGCPLKTQFHTHCLCETLKVCTNPSLIICS